MTLDRPTALARRSAEAKISQRSRVASVMSTLYILNNGYRAVFQDFGSFVNSPAICGRRASITVV
jgi:hypothetical protein